MMAQEVALKEVANSKRRRLLAHRKAARCAGVKIGHSVRLQKAPNRKSLPKWRGPACILDIYEMGKAVRYLSRTFGVA